MGNETLLELAKKKKLQQSNNIPKKEEVKKEPPKQPIQDKSSPQPKPPTIDPKLLEKYATVLGISKEELKKKYNAIQTELGGLMSDEGIMIMIQKDIEKEKQPKPSEFPETLMPFKERLLEIIERTGLSRKEIIQKLLDKITELKGLIETEGAITLVERELGLREEIKDAKTEEIVEEITEESPKEKTIPVNQEVTFTIVEDMPKKPLEQAKPKPKPKPKAKETIQEVKEEFTTEIVKKESQSEALTPHKLPTLKEIEQFIQRHEYVKKKIVNASDFTDINGKPFMCKSGWRKFINAFGLSIVLVSKRTYEAYNDKHCEVIVRAIAPSGQFVEGLGIKSWSELSKKTIHNLESTAWTKAVNRAVSDLVAFGEVSAEEMMDKNSKNVEIIEE